MYPTLQRRMSSGYIYLLQPLRSITSNEDIYKIGKTKRDNFKRFNEYPIGSILLLQSSCNNCDVMEKILLKIFDEKFIKKKDYGREYFQGDLIEMKKIINYEIMNEGFVINNNNNNNNNILSSNKMTESKESSINNYQRELYIDDSSINRDNESCVDEIYNRSHRSKSYEIIKKDKNNKHIFCCESCSYKVQYKRDFEKHLLTVKHKKLINELQTNVKNVAKFRCDCGKIYKYRQGLFSHKKKCTEIKENNKFYSKNKLLIDMFNESKDKYSLLVELCKNSQQFVQPLLDK